MKVRFLIAFGMALGLCACGVDGIDQARCQSICERQEADPQCEPVTQCPEICTAVMSAAERCQNEILAFWDCSEAADDLCTDPPTPVCTEENTAYAECIAQ